ncbi:MAG: hypothetical protein JWR58_5404 [Pseudonocardia sp.]|nr:hypothetical protein [Pseudonocardia sp.]
MPLRQVAIARSTFLCAGWRGPVPTLESQQPSSLMIVCGRNLVHHRNRHGRDVVPCEAPGERRCDADFSGSAGPITAPAGSRRRRPTDVTAAVRRNHHPSPSRFADQTREAQWWPSRSRPRRCPPMTSSRPSPRRCATDCCMAPPETALGRSRSFARIDNMPALAPPALRRISRDSTRCPSRSPENPLPGPSTTHRPETPNTAPGVSTCPNQQNTRPNPTKINPTAINALLKDRGVTGGVGHPGSGA